jgi:hypothetical protein
MHHVSPTRWRALPTALLVIGAIALGAIAARADTSAPPPAHHGSAVTPAAVR